ncbi:MAG TPA: dihydroorotase [Dehalococcoidia bacterium]|nr:dihydroorotase [Dehalococcoidia bacterium]
MGSLLIRGARLIDPARDIDRVEDVRFVDGRVVAGADGPAERVLDGAGLVLAPGFVDLHCHLREPGQEYKETIRTGLGAAVRGGFTTVCAMPNTEPATDNRSVVEFVLRTARAAGLARVLPIGAVTLGRAGKQLAELAELAEAGCIAFSDDGSPVADAELMRRALEYASGLGLAVINHCEEPSLAKGGVLHEGWVSTRLGLKGQPAAAEEAMVARDCGLAELTGAHVHIAHVSTAGSIVVVAAAKARGVHVTAEVTPHHLTLTDEAALYGPPGSGVPAYDTAARVNPPLRGRADRDACRRALAEGAIDCVATDHAPHALTDKECEFDQAAPGISGLETALPLLLELVQAGELSLSRAIEALTAAPVRALGLDRFVSGLGTLAPGAPADAVLLDPEAEWAVDPREFASLGKNTPFRGRRVRGRVIATIVDGTLVYETAALAAGA